VSRYLFALRQPSQNTDAAKPDATKTALNGMIEALQIEVTL
jgi:hypothetical protein